MAEASRPFERVAIYQRSFFRYALCFVAATMPFNNFPFTRLINSYAIVFLAIAWFLEGGFPAKLAVAWRRPLVLVFACFYLWHCVGMFYTTNISEGFGDLEQKSFLFILPVILGTSISLEARDKILALNFFVSGCFLATLLSLTNAAYQFQTTGDPEIFYYLELAKFVNFHPPYFGLYVAFSILIVIDALYKERTGGDARRKFLLVVLVVYFFCFLLLLSARMATIFLFLAFAVTIFRFFYKQERAWIAVVIFLAMAVLSTLIVSRSEQLRDRIIKPLTSDVSVISGGGETGLSIRLVKWSCSLEGFFEAPFLGVGTGDVLDYLFKCYERKNFWGMHEQYLYNSHNQYLQSALGLGVPGLLAFLLCLAVPLFDAYRKKERLFVALIALFAFCSLTESLLERQWGVVFAAFFIPLFCFGNEKEKAEATVGNQNHERL